MTIFVEAIRECGEEELRQKRSSDGEVNSWSSCFLLPCTFVLRSVEGEIRL